MHIGIDCRLPYYQMGGISRFVLDLLHALARYDAQNQYTLFHSRKDRHDYRPDNPNFSSTKLWTPCHHRWERQALAFELLPHNLDVFHSPDFIPPSGGTRRRIITVHDLNFLYYPQYLTVESRRYYNHQIAWAVSKADHIAADSEHTRLDLIKKLNVPAHKITTVPLAAHPIYASPVPDEKIKEVLQKYQLTTGFILFVGTLEPRKNISLLLQAYALMLDFSSIDVPLVLVGDKGWLYDDIFKSIEELGLHERVKHLSRLENIELAALYHSAGLLASPSHYEGFGFPALEAMHCGCPVLASNRASLPELVGPAGWLLDPDDVQGWSVAIVSTLEDTDRRQHMISAGFEQARKFTWERVAQQMIEIYTA